MAAALCFHPSAATNCITRMDTTMQMMKMNVTPEMAKSWLSTVNTANRSLSHQSVRKYADDMANGAWRQTHQNAIAFYDDGAIADGQHRLAAVVAAGVSVEMFVATGLTRDHAAVIDQGRPRSAADAIKISSGNAMDKYLAYAVAIVRMVYAAEVSSSAPISVTRVRDLIEKMYEPIEYSCTSLVKAMGGTKNAPTRAAIAVAAMHVDRSKLDQFCRVLMTGMPEGPIDQTVIAIRNKLMTEHHKKNGSQRIEVYKMVLRAIKAYDDGQILVKPRRANELAIKSGLFDEK